MLTVASILLLLTTPGCSPQDPAAACPTSWDAVVVWSSEEESETELQLYDGDRLAGRIRTKVQGAMLNLPVAVHGQRGHFVTNGDVQYDQTNLVTVDFTSCTVSRRQIDPVSVLDWNSDEDLLVTASGANGDGLLHGFDLADPAVPASTLEVADRQLGAVSLDRDHVYAFASEIVEGGFAELLVLDRGDLSVRSRTRIPLTAAEVTDSIVADQKLYFTTTSINETAAAKRLGVVDLATLEIDDVELADDSPYQLVADPSGRTVLIAHTFLNEAFAPYASFRYVTALDTASGDTDRLDVGTNLLQISMSSDGSTVLGMHGAGAIEDAPFFSSTPVHGPGPTRPVPIAKPEQGGFHYVASVAAR